MGNYYRMVGSQDPGSRIDSVQVEEATPDHPAKVLELDVDGIRPPVELEPYQAERVSRYVRLEPVEDYKPEEEPQIVDQPLVDAVSSSTENPPVSGVAPDLDEMSDKELREIARARGVDLPANAKKDDVRDLVQNDITEKGV